MWEWLEVLVRNVDGRLRVRCYWPTSFRQELNKEDWRPYYHIYIEDEEVEVLPYWTSEEDAEKRFNEILGLMFIECEDMFMRRPI